MSQVALIDAELHCGAQVIRYLRAGKGPVVLIVSERVVAPEVVAQLCPRFRVIAPEPPGWSLGEPAEQERTLAWLRQIVDGLGFEQVTLAVGPALEASARGWLQQDPDRFNCLILLVD